MTARDEQRQATQRKVTSAAERLFLERGFRATTVKDIAAEAGVSVGSVMTVGDKSALLVSMFDRSIAHIHEQRSEGENRLPSSTPAATRVDRLINILRPFLSVFETQMELAREYAAVLVHGGHSSAVFQELASRLMYEISVELADAGIRPDQLPAATRTIYLSYLGVLFAWAGSGAPDASEAIENLRSIFTFVVESKET
jgi:AcrR family transcriptional regulator